MQTLFYVINVTKSLPILFCFCSNTFLQFFLLTNKINFNHAHCYIYCTKVYVPLVTMKNIKENKLFKPMIITISH